MKRATFIYYLIGFVILLSLDLWKNYSDRAEELTKNVIAPFFDKIQIPLVYCILAGLFAYQFYRSKISLMEEETKDQMGLLIKANRRLSAFSQRDLLQDVMKQFISTQESVHAIQLYRYEVKKRLHEVVIKVEHVEGQVHEGIELNALGQVYFHVNRSVYRDFIKAKAILDKYNNVNPLIEFVRLYSKSVTTLVPDYLVKLMQHYMRWFN